MKMRNWLTVVGALLVFEGCAAKIGDDCGSNSDCGSGRLCDRSMKGGYCTISPCETNGCPEEAVCIEFFDTSTWCMKHCNKSSDCRDGYECKKHDGDYPYCVEK